MGNVKKTSSPLPWAPRRTEQNFKRGVSNYNFYNSTAWRKTSIAYRTANPVCEVAGATDWPEPSEVTDHIVPINQGGSRYDTRNLMALCHSIHNVKSGKEKTTPVLVEVVVNEDGDLIPRRRGDIVELLLKAIK